MLPSRSLDSHEARVSIHQTVAQLDSGKLRDLRILSLMPPTDVCRDLIDVYFDTFDQAVGSLFHRHSFLEAYEQKKTPVILLLCIFAIAARFSDHDHFKDTDRPDRGVEWNRQARDMLNLNTLDNTITSMQTCFLASTLAGSDGDIDQESICSSMASRIVQLSGLPYKLSLSPLDRELELRVWSSTYMLDIWTTTGRSINPTFAFDMRWPWPAEEAVFDKMRADGTQEQDSCLAAPGSRLSSIWGQMIRLTYIKSKVHELNYRLGELQELDQQSLQAIEALYTELQQWAAELPPRLRENEQNHAHFTSIGRGRSLVALHIGFHFHAVLLLFRFLSSARETKVTALYADYAERCKHHARSLSKLLWDSHDDYHRRCMWPRISHLLVISSSVHLHTLLLEKNAASVLEAREILHRNFRMITNLQSYWSNLGQAIGRLKVFHEACLSANRPETVFQMTEWLSRFLHEHSHSVMSLGTESSSSTSSTLTAPVEK
ncbi:fungal specific transcription factor domain-containing protein [Sarocladium implicatum]|nr:fungal specific transcription factor domain-containing protein [Sarocladium implicatum]